CVSDTQLQHEIQAVITAVGGTVDPYGIYFIFTAKGVGSCINSSECAFTYYCAYHGHSTTNGMQYANMPYAMIAPSACGSGQHPNGDDADATINVTSHEHNESITDPQLNAWYDRTGQEDGDK